MIDPGLRNERFRREAADPETGVVLLDVVLGYGAHPDPVGELAPPSSGPWPAGRPGCRCWCPCGGAAGDPQGLDAQAAALRAAGALVTRSSAQAARLAVAAAGLDPGGRPRPPRPRRRRATVSGLLGRPLQAVNVGVELFAGELEGQDMSVQRVERRPPAAGAEEALEQLAGRTGADHQRQRPGGGGHAGGRAPGRRDRPGR